MNNQYPLFLVSDKNYLQHTTTALCSILTHFDSEKQLTVFLLSENLGENDLTPIGELASIHPFELHLIHPDLSQFQNLPDLKGSKMTYLRLLIPELFPDLDEAVYMDSDIIAERDISPIWELVPAEYTIAGVPENIKLKFIQKRKIDLGLAPEKDYFNAGILWMNLKKMRDIHFADKVNAFIRDYPEKIVFHDQDILNAILKDDWFPLSRSWNFMTDPQNYDDKDYQTSLTEPVRILHYAGYLMAPWLFYSKCRKRDRYYFYLNRTAFKGYKPPKDLRGIILYLLPNKLIPILYRLLKKLNLR